MGETKRAVAVVMIGAAFALMVARAFKDMAPHDAVYILAAGRAWAAGADAYGADYWLYGRPYLGPGTIWAYPPQWFWIATPLSFFTDKTAFLIWKLANLTGVCISGILLYRAANIISEKPNLWIAALFAAALMTGDPTRTAFALGQTNLIPLFGLSVLMFGSAKERPWIQVLGLVIMLLKPQMGLLFVLLFGASKETRSVAVLAVGITAALCLPILFQQGIAGTIEAARGLFRNLDTFSTLKWNRPQEMTGLPWFGLPISPFVCVGLAALASWPLIRDPVSFWLVPIAMGCLFVPMHPYDLTLFPIFILFLPKLSVMGMGMALVGIGLWWRSMSFVYGNLIDPAQLHTDVWFASVLLVAAMMLAAVSMLVPVVLREEKRSVLAAD